MRWKLIGNDRDGLTIRVQETLSALAFAFAFALVLCRAYIGGEKLENGFARIPDTVIWDQRDNKRIL